MLIEILLVAVIVLILYHMFVAENFIACENCSKYTNSSGTNILNPFSWPYSATPVVEDIYVGKFGNPPEYPLTHLSTPDHVELVH